MQISSRFTIAVHILTCIDYFADEYTITSDFLAGSVGVNPVIIRQVILQLKAAGLVDVVRGKTGITLSRELEDITLYDVYEAVESVKVSCSGFTRILILNVRSGKIYTQYLTANLTIFRPHLRIKCELSQ